MMICAQFVILSMPVLYFYLYNIFALYVVFVRLIHRAAPSHRIASIVRSATMHVFLCLSFKFAIARRAAPSHRIASIVRSAASIHGFLCLSFKFAISRRAVISPNRFNRSIFGVYVRLFMSSAAMQLGENTVASAYGIG